MSSQSVEKTEPFLSSPADWGLWFMVVKKNAEGGQVWKYMDPSKTKDEIEHLQEPNKPTPDQFGGTTLAKNFGILLNESINRMSKTTEGLWTMS
jgi:hypothetical protein